MIPTIIGIIIFIYIISRCCCTNDNTHPKKKTRTKSNYHPKNNSCPSNSNKMSYIGYCGSTCIYYREEFLSSSGGIVGDYDSEGYTEYYCSLGHSLREGRFCEDYE